MITVGLEIEMYEIFNPEISGLEPPNPGIEKNARDSGLESLTTMLLQSKTLGLQCCETCSSVTLNDDCAVKL
jgi:hypothetical protein